MDFASILIKIGQTSSAPQEQTSPAPQEQTSPAPQEQTSPAPQEQTSPLNLMAIFLKRVNLLLDRSLNGIIRIAVEIIFTGRDLRI